MDSWGGVGGGDGGTDGDGGRERCVCLYFCCVACAQTGWFEKLVLFCSGGDMMELIFFVVFVFVACVWCGVVEAGDRRAGGGLGGCRQRSRSRFEMTSVLGVVCVCAYWRCVCCCFCRRALFSFVIAPVCACVYVYTMSEIVREDYHNYLYVVTGSKRCDQ